MKTSIRRGCIMATVMALVIMAVGYSAHAAEVELISERARVLMVQGSATPESAQLVEPISESARVLVGHWRKTTIVFEQPEDEHLILNADGSAENWVVTASSRSASTPGQWQVEGKILHLLLEGNKRISHPFTIYEEQLVFPNIPNRRRFWDKMVR